MSDFPVKILVGTDGSEDSMLAARAAISIARATGAELHVVHVGPAHVYPPHTAGPTPPTGTDEEIRRQAQEVLDWQVDEIEKEGGEIAKAHLRIGKPYEEILHVSEEIVAGLIVVGNQGFGQKFSRLKRFLMGSTSENVSRYALLGDGGTQGPLRPALGVAPAHGGCWRAEHLRVQQARQDLDPIDEPRRRAAEVRVGVHGPHPSRPDGRQIIPAR